MSNQTDSAGEMLDVEKIDTFRKHWESDKQWAMRKDFMLANSDINLDRLLCLAQLYVNIELLKNEYDATLMKEVQDLAKKIRKSLPQTA